MDHLYLEIIGAIGVIGLVVAIPFITRALIREVEKDYRNGKIKRENGIVKIEALNGCLSEEGCGFFCLLGLVFCGFPIYIVFKLNLLLSILIGFIAGGVNFYLFIAIVRFIILVIIDFVDKGVIR